MKCTHGATIGQIDEEAFFYLRSRGLDELSPEACCCSPLLVSAWSA